VNHIFFSASVHVMMRQPKTIKEDAHDKTNRPEQATLQPATLAGTCKGLETEWTEPGRVQQAA
jgi:hypothetical protein